MALWGWVLRVWLSHPAWSHGPKTDQLTLPPTQLEKHPRDLAARLRRGELLRDQARSGDTNALARARAYRTDRTGLVQVSRGHKTSNRILSTGRSSDILPTRSAPMVAPR